MSLYELFYKIVFDGYLFVPYYSVRSSSFQAGYSNIETAYRIRYSVMHEYNRMYRVSNITE